MKCGYSIARYAVYHRLKVIGETVHTLALAVLSKPVGRAGQARSPSTSIKVFS